MSRRNLGIIIVAVGTLVAVVAATADIRGETGIGPKVEPDRAPARSLPASWRDSELPDRVNAQILGFSPSLG